MTPVPFYTPAVVQVRDLYFGYEADRPVVSGLSADLMPGRLCALIGPNAAGKTTLLRLMMGQLRPWSGHVLAAGLSVWRMPPRRRASWLSYVPQRGAVSFAFTVEQVVAMGRYALASNSGAIEHALTACDLGAIRQRVYAALSAGQQQRVLLARAIAQCGQTGRVMLLDEPASAMDLWHVHRTMRLLGNMARSGLAVAAVLHDLNLAARYADDVWLLHEGRIAASGRWDEVLAPQVLEPVYRVGLTSVPQPGEDRPMFVTRLDG